MKCSTTVATLAMSALAGCSARTPAIMQLNAGAVCERVTDSSRIARMQDEQNRLQPLLVADPQFGWAAYEHVPCYRLVLAFTDGRPHAWVLAAASPELRRYITFAKARLTFADRERVGAEIRAALARTGVPSIFMSDVEPEIFTVGVRSEAEAKVVRRAIPKRYRWLTRVLSGWSLERRPE